MDIRNKNGETTGQIGRYVGRDSVSSKISVLRSTDHLQFSKHLLPLCRDTGFTWSQFPMVLTRILRQKGAIKKTKEILNRKFYLRTSCDSCESSDQTGGDIVYAVLRTKEKRKRLPLLHVYYNNSSEFLLHQIPR